MAGFRTEKETLVVFKKEFLTGPYAGMKQDGFLHLANAKAARNAARELRVEKVFEGEFTEDLYKVSNVRVVRVTKALNISPRKV